MEFGISKSYLLRRVLQAIPVLFGITLISFLIFNVVGGDPAYQLAGKNASPAQIDSIRQELGLNQSLLRQYIDFVSQTIRFDWGRSWHTHEDINSMLLNGVGPSLSLALPAFLISFLLSLGLALYTTYRRSTWVDRSITTLCLAMMSISFLVYIIVGQYVLAYALGLFPVTGWESDLLSRWRYLALPWLIWVTISLGPHILIFRAAFIDQADQDYVTTAKAKGLSNLTLYFRHILRNAMLPITTIVVMQVPFLITGSLLLEAFFGIPGLGDVLIRAIQNSDLPVIKAFTVIGSILYMFCNLAADIFYSQFDPRVRL